MTWLWTWLDGKKTIIGAIVLTLSAFAQQILVDIWHVDWAWLPNLINTFDWIGLAVGGTGLMHKASKALTEVPVK